jgi:VWFA-related protein
MRWAPPFLLLAALAVPCSGVDGLSEEVEVRLVEVDVLVLDRDGSPLTGLEQERFELKVDGKPVPVTHFSAPAPTAASRPDVPLNLAVVIDQSFLRPAEQVQALRALGEELPALLGPEDRLMVVRTDRGVEVVLPLTPARESLGALLEGLPTGGGFGLRSTAEMMDIQREIFRARSIGFDPVRQDPTAVPKLLLGRIASLAAETHRDLEVVTGNLRRVVAAMSGLPGRRALLYVSGRIPANAGQVLARIWQRAFGRTSALLDPSSDVSNRPDLGFDYLPEEVVSVQSGPLFAGVAHEASVAGVTLFAIDVGNLGEDKAGGRSGDAKVDLGGGAGLSLGAADRVGDRGLLEELAAGTGGEAWRGSGALDKLPDLSRALHLRYTLGFTSPEGSGPLDVEVRLRGAPRGARLAYRRAVWVEDADTRAAKRTLSVLLDGRAENPLEMTAAVGAPHETEEGVVLPVTVEVPFANLALVPSGRSHTGRLSVFLTAGSLEDGSTPVTKAVVPVVVDNEELFTSLGRTVEYTTELQLPGRFGGRLAIGVRDDFGPSLATLSVELSPVADRPHPEEGDGG